VNDAGGFEEAYHRLEAAVQKLEAGGLSLEDSIGLYEEATELAARCKELLDSAELRIKRLQERFAETPGEYEAAAPVEYGEDFPPELPAPSLFDRLGGAGE
jgi:exodeoxyribonuclease VII small subunit